MQPGEGSKALKSQAGRKRRRVIVVTGTNGETGGEAIKSSSSLAGT